MDEKLFLCIVAPLLYLLSDLLPPPPLPNVQYTQTVCDCGGEGCWNVLWTIFCRSFTLCFWPDSEPTKLLHHPKQKWPVKTTLKVLTNEKRGGLKVVAFDRSPFKLFSLKFSTKSVQAPSCERPKTTQQTLSLSFEIKNCFPIAVLCRSFMKKSGKLTCHVVIQTSLLILRRRTKYR